MTEKTFCDNCGKEITSYVPDAVARVSKGSHKEFCTVNCFKKYYNFNFRWWKTLRSSDWIGGWLLGLTMGMLLGIMMGGL